MSAQSRHRLVDQPVLFITAMPCRPTVRQRLILTLKIWRQRSAARRSLARMDARSLREVGISPAAAAFESGRSFWRPLGPLR